MIRATVLTQPDCGLCEHATTVLARVGQDHPLTVETISLDSETGRELGVRHGVAFAPGVLLEGTLFSYGRLSERRLRRHLVDTANPHRGPGTTDAARRANGAHGGDSDHGDGGDHGGARAVAHEGGRGGDGATPGQTAGKGRPTRSRREAQGGRRGPVAAAPTTQREAFRRARQTPGSRQQRRQAADDLRARRRAGDDRVLRARDRGPVRAHVRDLVDSRGHLLGLFAPLAVLGFLVALVSDRTVAGIAQLVALGLLAAMALEGILLGRQVTTQAREKFPDDTTPGGSLGWYAFTRAAQIRKLRTPAPRIARGDQATTHDES